MTPRATAPGDPGRVGHSLANPLWKKWPEVVCLLELRYSVSLHEIAIDLPELAVVHSRQNPDHPCGAQAFSRFGVGLLDLLIGLVQIYESLFRFVKELVRESISRCSPELTDRRQHPLLVKDDFASPCFVVEVGIPQLF
jgi:hypothetical protein